MKKSKWKKKFNVDNIYFDADSSRIKQDSYDILDKIVDILKANSDIKMEVSGHTDTNIYGTKKLSEDRAKSVVSYMINKGLSEDRFKYVGYGGTKPIYPGLSRDSFKNRRTEFYFFE